jgi:hypothetical protein
MQGGLEQAAAERPARLRWVTGGRTMKAIADIDPEVARAMFGNARAIGLGDGFPGATRGVTTASYAAFEAMIETEAIDPEVTVAMYDIERWGATPLEEQRHPVDSIRRFAALARSHGYLVMVTPHPKLVVVEGGECVQDPDESVWDAYLRCDIAGQTAAVADIVETQAQVLQRMPIAYRRFVAATARQARAANPDVTFISGLSTSPGYRATPEMLLRAARSVDGIVDGFYLSLARGRFPHVAVEFLRRQAVSEGA